MKKILVIGGGAMGSAFTVPCLENKNDVSVDLENQKITYQNDKIIEFEIDAFRKKCLLEGLDDIGLTLQKNKKIGKTDFEVIEKFDNLNVSFLCSKMKYLLYHYLLQ